MIYFENYEVAQLFTLIMKSSRPMSFMIHTYLSAFINKYWLNKSSIVSLVTQKYT